MRIPYAGRWLVVAALLGTQLGVVASAAVHDEPVYAGDLCARCRRIILERHVAAELVAVHETQALKFRTVRCLLAHLQSAPAGKHDHVYVVDYRSGDLVHAEKAVYVAVPIDVKVGLPNYGIGDTDFLAFKSENAAAAVAAEYGVTTLDWAAVQSSSAFLPSRGDVQ